MRENSMSALLFLPSDAFDVSPGENIPFCLKGLSIVKCKNAVKCIKKSFFNQS